MHSVHQHWDPLKVCIIGRSYPPEFYSGIKNSKVRGSLEKIAIETEEDYQKLKSKLEEFGARSAESIQSSITSWGIASSEKNLTDLLDSTISLNAFASVDGESTLFLLEFLGVLNTFTFTILLY